MLTEDYVSYETAKLLKEKGFDVYVRSFYKKDVHRTKEEFSTNNALWNYNISSFCYSTPTLQMAMKWLREVHNYDVSICLDPYVEPYDNQYYIVIRRKKDKYDNVSPCEQVYFDTYEEACEAAIKDCLENLI